MSEEGQGAASHEKQAAAASASPAPSSPLPHDCTEHDASAAISQTNITQLTAASAPASENGKWHCEACTYENFPQSPTMEKNLVDCKFYSEDLHTNRKILFREALNNAKNGKVLYIMHDELEELPELSQELSASNRHYMKMISFLYANSLGTLLESLSSLPEWQIVPTTIILDDLSTYCNKTSLHAACGIVALLLDSIRSCSTLLNKPGALYISATKDNVDEDFCNILRELYFSFYNSPNV